MTDEDKLIGWTAELTADYVANNSLPPAEIPALIRSIYDTLRSVGDPLPKALSPKPAPFVSAKKSVTPDYLICLEDGKKFKSLKRHLRAAFDLTPEAYRTKWDLPHDYPMVAPAYAAARSQMAKAIGLGRTPSSTAARRGRPPKAR